MKVFFLFGHEKVGQKRVTVKTCNNFTLAFFIFSFSATIKLYFGQGNYIKKVILVILQKLYNS